MKRTVTVSVLVGAVLVGGAGIAVAQEATMPPEQPPITLTAEQSATICQERIPAILARIARATERITGDAGAAGSTEWLLARADEAREDGRTARAERLEARVEGRVEVLERLAGLTERIEMFRDENCVT